jgi:hygromycin-B 7''-O-kinase
MNPTTRPSLPALDTPHAYWPFHGDPGAWLPAARDICRHHGFSADDLIPFPDGGNLVCGTPHIILKLFAPLYHQEFEAERLVLKHIQGLPVPTLLHQGEWDGWPYLILSRLPGVSLKDVWPGLDQAQRSALMAQLGELAATVHRHPPVGLEALAPDWPQFVRQQTDDCISRQQAAGLSQPWLDTLPTYMVELPAAVPSVLVHADLTNGNLLVSEKGGAWQISGVIDFADTLIGAAEYDHVGPAMFLCRGNRDLLRSYLLAYGYREDDLDGALSRRLMGYTLLHRFCNLPAYLKFADADPALEGGALEKVLWPL